VLAQTIGMEPAEFNRLNPGFEKSLSLGNRYDMRLPADKLQAFQDQKPQILEQSIRVALASAGR
jgi:membrane-bound lytic murein transglycosylase D